MDRKPVQTSDAPAAIGTYSQAIRTHDTVYVSGQIPLDPVSGELVNGDISAQIRQVFDNLRAVVHAAGGDLNNAVKITVYLIDLVHFPVVNQIMAEYLQEPYPARAAVGVTALPKGAAVEADAVVAL